MAHSVNPFTWKNGFRQPGKGTPWAKERPTDNDKEPAHYVPPPSTEILTSAVHNDLGLNVLRTWPTIYDGISSPHGRPEWWKKSREVDVLICGGSYEQNKKESFGARNADCC